MADPVDRIAGALTAYICGDALGVGWEGKPPAAIDHDRIEQLPARDGWVSGATSDDTALTLLVAEHLLGHRGPGTAEAFAATLAATTVPGIGPSTRNAIATYRSTGQLPTTGGATNGAPMRALPLGWATAFAAIDRRRRWTDELTRATHADPRAQHAARAVAAAASAAIDGHDPLAAALHEAPDIAELQAVSAGTWTGPDAGISLDPFETVAAALHCAVTAADLRTGLVAAVALGGDTDTVAAITGGLLGARHTAADVVASLPYSNRIALPEPALVERVAAGLAELRTA
jgi:ADP-ribosylglycohydrolase